ncbi:MAG: ATP-binding protein [Planctomycetales bacterium]|nr:ATP-binding protein [Planctomycetales bacterium]MCA9206220.1 ATP-binding protein [Planctomycetales bacterium]
MQLKLSNIGQIENAEIGFGDLTVFVGPQATGKSIALQFLKLIVDAGHVQEELARYGLDWSGKLPEFFDIYFGEGMRGLWRDDSSVHWRGKEVSISSIVGRKRRNKDESLFLIPAQRVLTLRDGWPRPFTDYSPGDPFAVREFSEKLRTLVEKEFGANENLFPQERRLKREYRDLLDQTMFGSFRLQVDKSRVQKRLVLGTSEQPLPYMVWSAGQREFVPLLLGLYWLMPSASVSRRNKIEWVVLEELEMGLHPRAISVLLLLVLELISRGYRVCLSTHSPQVLEMVWAIKHLSELNAPPGALLSVFGAPNTQPMQKLAESVAGKAMKVHYFAPTGVTRDISDLDLDSEEMGDGYWGGLSEFSSRANTAVARAVANGGR